MHQKCRPPYYPFWATLMSQRSVTRLAGTHNPSPPPPQSSLNIWTDIYVYTAVITPGAVINHKGVWRAPDRRRQEKPVSINARCCLQKKSWRCFAGQIFKWDDGSQYSPAASRRRSVCWCVFFPIHEKLKVVTTKYASHSIGGGLLTCKLELPNLKWFFSSLQCMRRSKPF